MRNEEIGLESRYFKLSGNTKPGFNIRQKQTALKSGYHFQKKAASL
jgi:hypothetical protein